MLMMAPVCNKIDEPELQHTPTGTKQKRSNKPAMEKKRREKINRSLNELKLIVLSAQKEDLSKFNKMEKADILAKTVSFLKCLQHKITEEQVLRSFAEGYERGLGQVRQFVNTVRDPRAVQVLSTHLRTLSSNVGLEMEHHQQVLRTQNQVAKETTRVKATVDNSVFTAGVIGTNGVISPGASPSWEGSSANAFPLSPPDSSRYSSSPDSLRGSPRNIFEQTSFHPVVVKSEKDGFVFYDAQRQHQAESAPLNLSHNHPSGQGASHSLPYQMPSEPSTSSNTSFQGSCRLITPPPVPSSSPAYRSASSPSCSTAPPIIIKQEAASCDSPPDQANQSGAQMPCGGVIRRHFLPSQSGVRSVPYPKKDAVHRYYRAMEPFNVEPDHFNQSHSRSPANQLDNGNIQAPANNAVNHPYVPANFPNQVNNIRPQEPIDPVRNVADENNNGAPEPQLDNSECWRPWS